MPGVVRSDSTYGDHIEQIIQNYPDRATPIVLYCNGPYCGKSKRTAQSLAEKGYTNVRRYQLGLPVWRALGNTVQTDLAGLAYILKDDRTAVFVDARSPEKFKAETIPGAVNVRPGETKVANEDGRLPIRTRERIVVFGDSGESARGCDGGGRGRVLELQLLRRNVRRHPSRQTMVMGPRWVPLIAAALVPHRPMCGTRSRVQC